MKTWKVSDGDNKFVIVKAKDALEALTNGAFKFELKVEEATTEDIESFEWLTGKDTEGIAW